MSETLKNIIDSYHSGLLSTPNIQVIEKKLSDERIEFPTGQVLNHTFSRSTFKNSELINMKFINLYCGSSYFQKCFVENCIFENISFKEAKFKNCVFKNCRFIDCDLNEVDATETIFNECTFLKNCFNSAYFELCHFQKSIFEDMENGLVFTAVLIDSTFSNSKESIKFEGEVEFFDVFDQIKKLHN